MNIAEFWNVYDAAVAVSALESAGIPAICPDWHLFHLKPNLIFGGTGARLWVLETDRSRSAEILHDGQQQRNPIRVCGECQCEAYHSSVWSALAYLTSFFLAGVGASAIIASTTQKSSRYYCPTCDKQFHIAPIAPFSEDELGYDPSGSSLGEMVRGGIRRIMSLRKL